MENFDLYKKIINDENFESDISFLEGIVLHKENKIVSREEIELKNGRIDLEFMLESILLLDSLTGSLINEGVILKDINFIDNQNRNKEYLEKQESRIEEVFIKVKLNNSEEINCIYYNIIDKDRLQFNEDDKITFIYIKGKLDCILNKSTGNKKYLSKVFFNYKLLESTKDSLTYSFFSLVPVIGLITPLYLLFKHNPYSNSFMNKMPNNHEFFSVTIIHSTISLIFSAYVIGVMSYDVNIFQNINPFIMLLGSMVTIFTIKTLVNLHIYKKAKKIEKKLFNKIKTLI